MAELIDNSVDAFLLAHRNGNPIADPEIRITVPTADTPQARVIIRDNAHGMDADTLENAVRAGWTSNDSVNSLGLFGMGFNIATARLGLVTTVWTSRPEDAEEIGIRIDFSSLQKSRTFRTPELRRPKVDPHDSGTTIEIEGLKPDQRAWFAKTSNLATLKKLLGRSYSSMLRDNGDPISFRLTLNGRVVEGYQHCLWSENRSTTVPGHGRVFAIQPVNHTLPERPYCDRCWIWLNSDETVCPECEKKDALVKRTRRVHGWVGVQRYLSKDEFGIDFIRNGRKIEIADTDLFYWSDGGSREPEYPIDDPSRRGRIVGEIHLDHARVNYTKNRFDRNDPAWAEMVRIVRGAGPLRPEKANQAGYSDNSSPLYKLYQAFRRSNPRPKVAGCWAKLLIVPNNDTATEYSTLFHKKEPGYLTDEKWWALVEEADSALLLGATGGPQLPASLPGDVPGSNPDSAPNGGIPGFGVTADTGKPGATTAQPAAPPVEPVRESIPSLSQDYRERSTGQVWRIEAYRSTALDPELIGDRAWSLKALSTGVKKFFVNVEHPVFRSLTLTPLDALLAELANRIMDAQRGSGSTVSFDVVLSNLRDAYSGASKIDPAAMVADAAAILQVMCRRVATSLDRADATALFDELGAAEQEHILARMATRSVRDPQQVIAGGRFLEFAPRRTIARFYDVHPELFFDGRCFDAAYGTLEFPNAAATDEARRVVFENYRAMLQDVVWLADQDPSDMADLARERVLRCSLAVDLLSMAAVGEGSE